MSILRFTMRGSFALALTAAAAACAHQGAAVVPQTTMSAPALLLPEAKLHDCKGQQNSKQYATITVTLSSKGGTFCIPTFGGFGGSVNYPGAKPSIQLTVTSSTKNYDNMPKLGSGTPLFYLQLALSGGTQFGSKAKIGGGLTGKKLAVGETYTVFGQAKISSFPISLPPCYAVATKGKYGGVIGGIGTLLQNQSVPSAATAAIEIYSGQQASQQC
ncbi:MAG: hypothetical protein JO104_11615 [Candidatus Eremiobacteraeota bacterium]|nr:hypothetical protein [Candidatus Eremiobacteraeota bacterium]